jgi:D-alanyl-D-alanine dipeptidase
MIRNLIFISILIFVFISCKNKSQTCNSQVNELKLLDSLENIENHRTNLDHSEKLFKNFNLVDIQEINKTIKVDLKYATSDNFMKIKLYDKLSKAYLQKDVAERLSKCQDYLTSIDPKLYLLIYDAVRPLSTQQKMWDALDTIPFQERTKFVSNPENGSVHNYGAAVDLTICNSKGEPLDMGAGYDDIRKIAYPSLEDQFLSSGQLSIEQIENRKLLRKVMTSQGFINIPSEWWHFNACSRSIAKKKYNQLLEE